MTRLFLSAAFDNWNPSPVAWPHGACDQVVAIPTRLNSDLHHFVSLENRNCAGIAPLCEDFASLPDAGAQQTNVSARKDSKNTLTPAK